jgi:hypothetical protein
MKSESNHSNPVGSGEPYPIPKIASFDWVAIRGGEHVGVRFGSHERVEVRLEFTHQRHRYRYDATPDFRLWRILDHQSRFESKPFAHYADGLIGQIHITAAQSRKLALSEPGQTCRQDKSAISLRHRSGESIELFDRSEALLSVMFHSTALDPTRVPEYSIIVHGLAKDLAQPRIRLGGDRRPTLNLERPIPGANQVRVQIHQLDASQCGHRLIDGGQNMKTELRRVYLPCPLCNADPLCKPLSCEVIELDLTGSRVESQSRCSISSASVEP